MYRARGNSAAADPTTVADLIVTRIAEYSTYVFGVGGANIEDIYDAVHRNPAVTGIIAKHEFGAATMADGYARATNRLGVVAATSGGGALNLVAALGESFDSRIPVLALVGQPPLAAEGQGAFQDTSGAAGRLDAERLFGAVARHCVKLTSVDDVDAAVQCAIDAALDGGSSVLLLPKDIQTAAPGTRSGAAKPPAREGPGMRVPTEVIDVLSGAASGPVVIIAGPEIARADARAELRTFAEALGARVVLTPDGKDGFANDHTLFAGVSGTMGHPQVPDLIHAAGICVLVGTPLPITARAGLEPALASCPTVVHIGNETPYVRTDLQVTGSLAMILRELTVALPVASGVPIRSDRLPPLPVPPATGPGLRYREAVQAISAHLDPGTGIVADAGNTGAAVVHHLPVPEGGRFLIALGMGGMGYSFGAGIGTALGRGQRTFVIAGDGAYFMHGHEVHTAVEYHVPVTFVVFNNNAHAMCVTREQLYFRGEYTFNRFRPARIGAGVAATFPDLLAYTVATVTDLVAALDKTRGINGPAFLEVLCDADEFPPFAPFLKEKEKETDT